VHKCAARVKQGGTLAITIAQLPIVFPQMLVCFSAYITYDWDLHKAWHPNGPTPLSQWHITLGEFRVGFWKNAQCTESVKQQGVGYGEETVPHP